MSSPKGQMWGVPKKAVEFIPIVNGKIWRKEVWLTFGKSNDFGSSQNFEDDVRALRGYDRTSQRAGVVWNEG